MLDRSNHRPAPLPADLKPQLIVVVDTEEEFDWSKPLSRAETGVSAIACQARAHRVFERFRVKPIYVCDYPVASQRDGVAPLAELLKDGLCEIGAHLHPWVSPPHDEVVSPRHSYPGNLPPDLEREKLKRLTETIESSFGVRPTVYRAGRYGVGRATPATLQALGYTIDTSVVPHTDFTSGEGPDFRGLSDRPYWFGPTHSLLELPLSVGFAGLLKGYGRALYPAISGPSRERLHLPGIAARLGLLERIRLTPEGVSFEEMRRLARAMHAAGHRVFVFSYHSPSLDPGRTPYVASGAELGRFLDACARFFEFFMGELGGEPSTPGTVREAALAARRAGAGDTTPEAPFIQA